MNGAGLGRRALTESKRHHDIPISPLMDGVWGAMEQKIQLSSSPSDLAEERQTMPHTNTAACVGSIIYSE